MSSIYDKVKTPKELIDSVKAHGFSTKQEDICRAQDIFGRAPIDDLVALANDNGRRNDNGEPDPEGSISCGREGTRKYFYQILFHIWNWEDATRFYNQYSNPDFKRVKELERDKGGLEKRVNQLTERRDFLVAQENKWAEAYNAQTVKLNEETTRANIAEAEVIKLKAMLFDLMYAKEVK